MQTLADTTWRLLEAHAFDEAGVELPSPLEPQPMGIATFDAERMIVAVSDGRAWLPADVQMRQLISHCGSYRFEGEKVVTRVDGASNPEMLGTEEIRSVRFEGGRMIVTPMSTMSRLLGRSSGLVFIWERLG